LDLPWFIVLAVLPVGHLLGVDRYDPTTNTVYLYSDHPAILLHEAGHAHNSSTQPHKGTYAFLYQLAGIQLFEEYHASERAIFFFTATGDRHQEFGAYKILYPAYGTYLGSHLLPFGNIPGAVVGHVWGRLKARSRARYYAIVNPTPLISSSPSVSPAAAPQPATAPPATAP
jgi:hypothetical protein